jgi:hypothetical protein
VERISAIGGRLDAGELGVLSEEQIELLERHSVDSAADTSKPRDPARS